LIAEKLAAATGRISSSEMHHVVETFLRQQILRPAEGESIKARERTPVDPRVKRMLSDVSYLVDHFREGI